MPELYFPDSCPLPDAVTDPDPDAAPDPDALQLVASLRAHGHSAHQLHP